MEKPSPGLIPLKPVALPPRMAWAAVVLCAGAAALLAAAGGLGWGSGPRPGAERPPEPVISLSSDVAPGAFRILPATFQDSPGTVLSQLDMPEPEKRRLAESLARDGVRLAAVTLWDAMDEDGDVVEVAASGFSQRLTIVHKPTTFFVPVRPGAGVSVTAVRDGGGGGVTLGIGTVLGPVRLPPLRPGQRLEIPAL